MKKEFFDDIDWDDVISNTYTDINSFKPEYSLDENGRKVINKEYSNDDIKHGKELLLDDDLYAISDFIFYNCPNLSGTLDIPDSVEEIGWGTFSNCYGFNGNLNLGNSIVKIDSNAFSNCYGFNGSLILPKGIKEMGLQSFSRCSGFTGELIIPESVEFIGSHAFDKCIFDKIYVSTKKINKYDSNWNSGCIAEIIKY